MEGSKESLWIVHWGPMFSGKTNALIEATDRAKVAKKRFQVFKLYLADRGEGNFVVRSQRKANHGKQEVFVEIPATPVGHAQEILHQIFPDVKVVGIDEIQFFDSEIVPVVRELAYEHGLRVVMSGLANDFRHELFGHTYELAAKADESHQHFSICQYQETPDSKVCGYEKATRTQRLINGQPAHWDSPIVLVGGSESYEARCVRHHFVPGRPY